ncbi:MAG: Cytochrome c oxidase subunit 3 [Holosporales bacterium]
MSEPLQKKHPFHIVEPSPWPFALSMGLLVFIIGSILAMHKLDYVLLIIGLLCVLAVVSAWLYDVVKESRQKGVHTKSVQNGLKIGMILFIASELMLFVAFFWSYFNAALDPITFVDDKFIKGVWPPKGVQPLEAFDLPYLNTLILLLSGTTVTWAHHALKKNNLKDTRLGLLLTIILGLTFTALQALEYGHTAFKFTDGIYATTFFLATGLHGAHVIVGTLLLLVCYIRTFKEGDITQNHHVGFQTSVWYWHFVDVVWMILFCSIYWWGGHS